VRLPALRPFGPGSMLIMWPIDVVRERGIGRLQSSGFYMANLVFSHECNRLQAQDADSR
jgi:hypothetical protein